MWGKKIAPLQGARGPIRDPTISPPPRAGYLAKADLFIPLPQGSTAELLRRSYFLALTSSRGSQHCSEPHFINLEPGTLRTQDREITGDESGDVILSATAMGVLLLGARPGTAAVLL